MIRPIAINPVLNGFIVNVGCQALAYTDLNEMLGDLGDYLRNPDLTERRILRDKAINREHTLGPTDPPPPNSCDMGAQADVRVARPAAAGAMIAGNPVCGHH